MPHWPDLYLMRHGQTVWNAEGRLQGRADSPLTPLGRQQAQRQAELVRGIRAQRISSSSGRAIETARIVFDGQDFQLDDRLQEIDIGDFTGLLWPEICARSPEARLGGPLDWYDLAPGGEHMDGLETRVRAFLTQLSGPALVVTHGITLHMLRLVAMNLPRARLGELPLEQGALHIVSAGQHRMLT